MLFWPDELLATTLPWSRNRFFIVLKTHPALIALKAGYRVVFSEMDIFWLRDPLAWVRTRNASRIFRNCSDDDLPHPHRKLKLESKKWADRAFALHLWSMHVGKPEQRINRVKELGYLFVDERPPAACDRLPH